jgi:hypothetical protein
MQSPALGGGAAAGRALSERQVRYARTLCSDALALRSGARPGGLAAPQASSVRALSSTLR